MLKGSKQFNLPEIEEKVLKFWREHKVFERSVALRSVRPAQDEQAPFDYAQGRQGKESKNKVFRFFEGPPTANGRPGIHHVLGRAFKDIILRYKTMRGYCVPRRAGWDTHGLPVELEVEKELGLKSKLDIEKYGVAAFNERAKMSVLKYKDEWEKLTERVGMWLDFSHPYITYENSYIETLWWIFSQFAKRRLLKKAYKVAPFCPRCQTSLSSHELAQPGAYKLTKDPSVFVKFKIRNSSTWLTINKNEEIIRKNGDGPSTGLGRNEFLLVWTTTPWTLPANVAVAINPKLTYTQYRVGDELLWSYNVPPVKNGQPAEVIKQLAGAKMVGWQYEPLYEIRKQEDNKSRKQEDKKTINQENQKIKKQFYSVVSADFVETEQGTGLVHIAPAFGEDDFQLIDKEWQLVADEIPFSIDETGKIMAGLPGAGKFAKEGDADIVADLQARGLLYESSVIEHEYPFCWRCGTPLLYIARSSWFVEMSRLREKLLAANAKINWVPAHLKEGRFGEWLREVKDWNISRERYWGTPLPIWECEKCPTIKVAGSLADLNEAAYWKNKFFLVRHGEAEHTLTGIIAAGKETPCHRSKLTKKGRADVEALAKKIKKEKIGVIISSPYFRAKQTAEIIARAMGVKKIIYDGRLGEINCGIFNGRSVQEHRDYLGHGYADGALLKEFAKAPPEGESYEQLRARMVAAIADINKQYQGQRILIVSHGDPLWILEGGLHGLKPSEFAALNYIQPATYRAVEMPNAPFNQKGEVDLHRPFIDEVFLRCEKCRSRMRRVKEVADVWFDSGAMPWAQWHYPFENKKMLGRPREASEKALYYPADYISEGMDQTRGWFYTLVAVATALGWEAPFHNVVSTGLILDKNGQKMSKSKGNMVDPWQMFAKYGADAVRWNFFTMNSPGEAKRFDEADLLKVTRRLFAIVYNSFVFLDTYGSTTLTTSGNFANIRIEHEYMKHVLDQWILARWQEAVGEVTAKLEDYSIDEAGRAIELFVDDLSRWYIRRSRRRFQKPEKDDLAQASATLRVVLLGLAKLLAPFTPFFAESLYLALSGDSVMTKTSKSGEKKLVVADSVHLTDWPLVDKNLLNKDLLTAMAEVRRLASLALAKRAEAGIKVRQPLASFKIKNQNAKIKNAEGLLDILKDEINVKEIIYDPKIKDELELDTKITPELREEGMTREFVRLVQDLRQAANYKPSDKARLAADLPEKLRTVIDKNSAIIKKEANLASIEFKHLDKFDAEIYSEFEGEKIWLGVRK